jgi:hypothetical protein
VCAPEKQAYELFLSAAEQGDQEALLNLGNMWLNGHFVQKDAKLAFDFFELAAKTGYARAQINVGAMYYSGEGVEQNYEKAFEWFLKAADQGYAPAQHNLGYLYEKGEGVLKDTIKASEWYSKAQEHGYVEPEGNSEQEAEQENPSSSSCGSPQLMADLSCPTIGDMSDIDRLKYILKNNDSLIRTIMLSRSNLTVPPTRDRRRLRADEYADNSKLKAGIIFCSN